jgi:protein-tyrosine phosphatase
MIDLHCHIIYGVDDGARTREEALEMARLAAADGARVIVATPHSPESVGSRIYDPALIRERSAELTALLREEGVDVGIVPGTEIAYSSDVLKQLQRGDLLTYNSTRTILLELAGNVFPPGVDVGLFNLQVAGYRVVLAHPERIVEVQRDPNVLLPFVERGILAQVTAEALLGRQGQRLQRTATTLVQRRMAHIIASDSHGLPPRRPPFLRHARQRAVELVGEEIANALVRGIPEAILRDQPATLPTSQPEKKRSG